jgi:hypothetical protein
MQQVDFLSVLYICSGPIMILLHNGFPYYRKEHVNIAIAICQNIHLPQEKANGFINLGLIHYKLESVRMPFYVTKGLSGLCVSWKMKTL